MKNSLITIFILGLFFALSVFGATLSATHKEHHNPACPFSATIDSLCDTPFGHIEHWQSTFTTILKQLPVVFFGVVVFLLLGIKKENLVWFRIRKRCLFVSRNLQELFSQGILHRKEDYLPQLIY